MAHTLSGHVTLITGGTGSFGRAFIRHVLADSACDARIVSLSRNAELRYQLEQQHLSAVRSGRLVVAPGDVRQLGDLMALAPYGITTIIHAAAEKHIGTGERFGEYTRSVNFDGAVNVLAFARAAGATRVLALSTDKATTGRCGEPPANLYGQTKQDAERLFVRAAHESGPTIALVRYGNVVASSGSVLPLFLEQRRAGVLTVTDVRMTRFAMPLDREGSNGARVTMREGRSVTSAVGLVLDALEAMQCAPMGAIFVPDIPSHHVLDLARTVGPGCVVREVGIRPGERLHEVLISPSEACRTWTRPGGGWLILPSTEHQFMRGARVPVDFFFSSDQHPLPVEWKEAV